MGPECHGCVRGIGFGLTPSDRKTKDVLPYSTTPQPSYVSDQRFVELEDPIETLTQAQTKNADKIETLTQSLTEIRNERTKLTQFLAEERNQRLELA